MLDAATASDDDYEFRSLKETHNRLFHGEHVPSPLPTERVQKLLLKYMKQHLSRSE